MRLLALACVLTCSLNLLAQDSNVAPPESGEMKQLFNGKDLTGWDGDPRLWSVKDGVIHGETTDENKASGNTFLIWQDGKQVISNCDSRSAATPPTTRASNIAASTSPKAKSVTNGSCAAINMNCATKSCSRTHPASSTMKAASVAASAWSAKKPLGKKMARRSSRKI